MSETIDSSELRRATRKSGHFAFSRSVWLACVVVLLLMRSAAGVAQSRPTAARSGDLQVGGGFSSANSDYASSRIKGIAFYSSFDFKNHFGVEVDFHQLNQSGNQLYERTYEAGGRYVRHYGRVTPYAKALYGRGVLNFPYSVANVAYNMLVGGGGADITVHKHINVRLDAEYQRWFSGPDLANGLTPLVLTGGVAYRFGVGRPRQLIN